MEITLPYASWDVQYWKNADLYFHLPEITNVKPESPYVVTKNEGEMLMFGSYSYLGLIGNQCINEAAVQALNDFGTGTHGVRLLAGTLNIHNQLENEIANFKQAESSIAFASGYIANISTISALLSRHDLVICDKLDHASILDGCLLSGAKMVRFQHNNMEHLESSLKKANTKYRRLVIVDGVYSMDGDIANLPEISRLCKEHGALLMVDEAHSIGVLGETGRGIEEHFNLPSDTVDIKMGTLSKAIPSIGGYVAGNASFIEALKHQARGFVYSAAIPPASVAASLAALNIIKNEPERLAKLRCNVSYFRNKLCEAGFNILGNETPIAPVVFGDDLTTTKMMMHCVHNGIFVQAILPPVVPKNSARLRATVTANHSEEHIDFFVDTLKQGLKEVQA